ncbi:MAG: hypothetical protein HOH43_09430 [Candidatus Latescibacteria bacterium]|nr:hypothetical protein [Candidatus Latescibacterota bacterium]
MKWSDYDGDRDGEVNWDYFAGGMNDALEVHVFEVGHRLPAFRQSLPDEMNLIPRPAEERISPYSKLGRTWRLTAGVGRGR